MISLLQAKVIDALLDNYGFPRDRGNYRLSIATFPAALQVKYKKDWSLFVQNEDVFAWLQQESSQQQLLYYYAAFTAYLLKKGKGNIFRPRRKIDLLKVTRMLLQPNLVIAGAMLNGLLLASRLSRLHLLQHQILTAQAERSHTALNLVQNFSFSGLIIYQANGSDKDEMLTRFVQNELTKYLVMNHPPILLVNPPTWLSKQQLLSRPLSNKIRWFPLVKKPDVTIFICRTKDSCLVIKYHITVLGYFFAPYRLNLLRQVSQQVKRWWNQCFSPT